MKQTQIVMRCKVIPWFILYTLACCYGCRQETGIPRIEINGTVTHQGQPIPKGRIDFRPDVSQGNDGPAGYAKIINGAFDTRSDGRGVVKGPHVVIINGFDGQPTDVEGLRDGMPLFDPHRTTIDIKQDETNYDFGVQ